MPHYIPHRASSIKKIRDFFFFFLSTIASWKLQPPVWKPASANCGSLLWPWACRHVSEGLDNRIRGPLRLQHNHSLGIVHSYCHLLISWAMQPAPVRRACYIDKSWCIFCLPIQHPVSVLDTERKVMSLLFHSWRKVIALKASLFSRKPYFNPASQISPCWQ